MSSEDDQLCAVLVGRAATGEKAEAIARNARGCPYVALYAASGQLVVALFGLPRTKRWWIEYPQDHPELLGLERVAVTVIEDMEAASPWARGAVEPTLSVAPCSTVCGRCPQYRARCEGCPATTYYAAGEGLT